MSEISFTDSTGIQTPTSTTSTVRGDPFGAVTMRTIGAGRCTADLVSGRVRVACTCRTGLFELHRFGNDRVGELDCRHCCHLLDEHEDFEYVERDSERGEQRGKKISMILSGMGADLG